MDGSTSERVAVVVSKPESGERARVSDPAKLILRTRKADADAFESGKLGFDEFRNKVTTMIY